MITLIQDPYRQLMKKFTNQIVKAHRQSCHNLSLQVLKNTSTESLQLESSFQITKKGSRKGRNKNRFHKL